MLQVICIFHYLVAEWQNGGIYGEQKQNSSKFSTFWFMAEKLRMGNTPCFAHFSYIILMALSHFNIMIYLPIGNKTK